VKSFQYQKSLDLALEDSHKSTLSLIEELIQRGGLSIAMKGRDEDNILPILHFLHNSFFNDPTLYELHLEAFDALLDSNPWLYSTSSPAITGQLEKISIKISKEINQHKTLGALQGILELILPR